MFSLNIRRNSSCFFLCAGFLFFLVYCSFGHDNKVGLPPNASTFESNALPAAVPVLTQEEASKANEEALIDFKARQIARQKEIRNQKIKIFTLSVFFIVVSLLIGYFRKPLRRYLIRFYKSPYGRLFYCRPFGSWDWLGITLVFGLTFFFSILAGQKAISNGFVGTWYANFAVPVAISIYNTGEPKGLVVVPESKLDAFLKAETGGNRGTINEHALLSITNEEAIPQKYTGETCFFESTGIAWLIAFWWKIIGYPDWSSLFILFGLFYALTAVAAYCALRQVTGTVPSIILGLLLSSYPSMMHQSIFVFRDGARALFCFIAIAILLYQLKGSFRWKGTVISSLFLLVICSLSTYFRQDFIVLIPFIVVATIFFHGRIYSFYKKKITVVLSIVLGIIISFSLPGLFNWEAMGHVLYIGMADHPYMDLLHFSADNYSKNITYADTYGFMFATGKAYRDRGTINVGLYSKEYDQECRKEIHNLFKMYPYDFFRIALSSFIQSMHLGSTYAERELKWIDSAPGYAFFQGYSKDFYSNVPSWLYILLLSLTVLLFLGGGFNKNIFIVIPFMFIGGIYALQFDVRHYFYLLIVSLLLAGFVFDRYLRILFILLINGKRIWKFCVSKKKTFFIHCAGFAMLVGFAFVVLFIANIIQTLQIKREIVSFNTAKTETIEFKTNHVISKLDKKLDATEVLLPGFFNRTLERENAKQRDFTDFLKIRFSISDAEPHEKVSVFAKYENAKNFDTFPLNVATIVNTTWTCPARLSFSAGTGLNTLYMPIYYSRRGAPFVGVELVADGKSFEIESVERILETDNIRTQSAFLVPSQPDDMKYVGNIDWNKIFWGEKNRSESL